MTFIRSFLIAGIVAALFGFGLKNVFGLWEATILAFVLQFVIAFVYSSLKINKNTTLTTQFEAELEELLSLSEGSVACPCGNYVHKDNIFLNSDNMYTCEKCNNEFRIDISLTPTLLTEPVDINKTLLTEPVDINKKFEQLTKEDIPVDKKDTKGTEL